MAYEKHTWVCGETITAELLNAIEGGIDALQPMILTFGGTTEEEADAFAMGGNAYLNATWQEINDAFRAGRRIVPITNPYIEATLATQVVSEIIGVSGAVDGAGLLDNKFSVQMVFGQNNTAPRFISCRCDNATDRPYIAGPSLMSLN